MKTSIGLAAFFAASVQTVSAHCESYSYDLMNLSLNRYSTDIWTTLVHPGGESKAAVRQPVNNSPVQYVVRTLVRGIWNSSRFQIGGRHLRRYYLQRIVRDYSNSSSTFLTNLSFSPGAATETVSIPAGSSVGFLLDNVLYHQGPASVYLGKAPSTAAAWDGSGASWFKVRPLSLLLLDTDAPSSDRRMGGYLQSV